MAGRSRHEKENDAFRFWRKMRLFRSEWIGEGGWRGPTAVPKEAAQGDGAQTDAALLEKPATGDEGAIGGTIKMRLAIHKRSAMAGIRSLWRSVVYGRQNVKPRPELLERRPNG